MKQRIRSLFIWMSVMALMCIAVLSYSQVVRSALMLKLPVRFSDSPGAPNPVESLLIQDSWKPPHAGDRVAFQTGESTWNGISAGPDGWFPDSLLDGQEYVYAELEEPSDTVLLLKAMGNDIAYVNGSPRPGNPYADKETYESWETHFDYSLLPVALRRGTNQLLFRCTRGKLKVSFFPVAKSVQFNLHDLTLPDIVRGEALVSSMALPVINATKAPLHDLILKYRGGETTAEHPLPSILPMSVRKEGFPISIPPVSTGDVFVMHLTLTQGGRTLDTATIQLRVVGPGDVRKETFVSEIDGSVQYYAIMPPSENRTDPKALILSLHGAGVEASGQAAAYEHKPWAWIVAPTNRRPYGFNWEDWGRIDAFEVLNRALKELKIDTTRIYLTGHSMGGHGAWQIGGLFPDRFAAVGPSAGWITYWSYRIREQPRDTTPVTQMLRRALATSETPEFVGNFLHTGLYILHGEVDDNVPIQQSYLMLDRLKGVLNDYVFHVQPKEGHWWDESPEPGADCVDWAPMMDYFARHRRPPSGESREVQFATANPGVSSTCDWVTVASQIHSLQMSTARLQFDPGLFRFSGSTDNVRVLGLDLRVLPSGDSVHVTIDGAHLNILRKGDQMLWLTKKGADWTRTVSLDPSWKTPARNGPFKDAFRHRALLIYGTHGTSTENALVLDRVRYDSEKFWYQGNGSLDVVEDRECNDALTAGRNLVLYGNSSTNSVWNKYLSDSPVIVRANEIAIAGTLYKGGDQCALFIRPRAGTSDLSIGAIGVTGEKGVRLLSRIPYFNSYLGIPDFLVLSAKVLTSGEEGVHCTGFFGEDWSLDRGDAFWSGQ